VDTNGFDVYDFCNFYTGPSGNLDYIGVDSAGDGNIVFGPPQEVVGVSCAPTGANNACLPEYSKFHICLAR
jgi:hypothetical protein